MGSETGAGQRRGDVLKITTVAAVPDVRGFACPRLASGRRSSGGDRESAPATGTPLAVRQPARRLTPLIVTGAVPAAGIRDDRRVPNSRFRRS